MSEAGRWTPKGLVAVIDTSVLVAARLSTAERPTSSREVVRLAGVLFDSFTSPAILDETEAVLARPRFGIPAAETRRWLDVVLRHSRQVDPSLVPGSYAAAVRHDEKDSPVLRTALAVNLHEEGQRSIAVATSGHGCFIVSWDRDFVPGRNFYGWTFSRPDGFHDLLVSL